jgi:hypothetical protein
MGPWDILPMSSELQLPWESISICWACILKLEVASISLFYRLQPICIMPYVLEVKCCCSDLFPWNKENYSGIRACFSPAVGTQEEHDTIRNQMTPDNK